MRKGLLWVLGVLALGSGSLAAQQTLPLADTKTADEGSGPGTLPAATPGAPEITIRSDPGDGFRYWARAEYLLWWVKGAPVPAPLVTTGDATIGPAAPGAPFLSGAIGQPGTRVLYGNSTQNLGAFSGLRFDLGGWLDNEHAIGVEGSAFALQRNSGGFNAASNAAGNPPLYYPSFSVTAQAERANPISDPVRGFSGGVAINNSLQLWGSEINGLLNVFRRPGLEVNLLAGFRYVDLLENLDNYNTTVQFPVGGGPALNVETLHDHFGTRNQFYGGQFGARVSWQRERWEIDLDGKVALGATHEIVAIQGVSSETALVPGGAPTPGTFPGGYFARPTNMGTFNANQFTVMPSLELKVAYQITPRIRAFAGYDFMYWNQVVRPGNQIDRNINITQNPLFTGVFAPVGPNAPNPQFNRTDFWANGVNFGLEFKF